MNELTHFGPDGKSRMVDVSDKPATARLARASASVRMRPETLSLIRDHRLSKGNVLEVARLAAIMAAKQTPQLIPLCHAISISGVDLEFQFRPPDSISIEATVRSVGQTGVEMEAMTAVTVAALTVYDMCKSIDREMRIDGIQLEEKSGGKSGHFVRSHPAPVDSQTSQGIKS
jgi:cyclic pyranopterin phosphate synthase